MATLEGVLRRQMLNTGSKSEHVGSIIDVNGAPVKVILIGENPFEQPTLSANEGKRVRVTGNMVENTFRATNVEQIQ